MSRSVQLHAAIPTELDEETTQLAEELEVSRAEVVRCALESYLALAGLGVLGDDGLLDPEIREAIADGMLEENPEDGDDDEDDLGGSLEADPNDGVGSPDDVAGSNPEESTEPGDLDSAT
jgi:hypothetical protein